jgi:hypothetical protein
MFLILKPMKFVIRKEFKDLIPPSSDDELDGLEKRILYEGCRDPLVLWFDEEDMEPEEWIVENQFSRRNLDTCYLIWFSIL